MGLTVIQELSHAMENVLGLIRSKKLVPNPDIINVLLLAADQLQRMVEDVHSSNEVNITEHIIPLNAIVEGGAPTVESAVAKPQEPSSKNDEKKKAKSKSEAKSEPTIEPQQEAQPEPDPDQQTDIDQNLMNESELEDDAEMLPSQVITQKSTPTSSDLTTSEPTNSSRPQQKVETTIRVHVSLLDQLMTLAGELVLSRNQLLQTIVSEGIRNAESVGQRIDLITSELQEAIMLTRMQPIGNVFNKFPRVVRDLAKKLQKNHRSYYCRKRCRTRQDNHRSY
jgi:two-component system chemotaxis sensor kinase CheA